MKFFVKKIYFTLFFLITLFINIEALAKSRNVIYTKDNISNYFSGIIFADQGYNKEALKHLKRVQSLKNVHSKYNIEFIRTLILLNRFEEAFIFAESIWDESVLFFEVDLLLGLNSFINEDYVNAEKYFKRLNKISQYNLFYEDFFGNILIIWNKASEGNKKSSFEFLEKVPNQYLHLKKIQNGFLQCYFDTDEKEISFGKLIQDEGYNFSRYNFFVTNYLLSKNKKVKAKEFIQNSRKVHNSNLLLKQTENFIKDNQEQKVKNFFNCQNPRDVIAEFFYIMANLLAGEKNYQLSNFYLKISLYLNEKFLTNKALLAENFYYQKKYKLSKNIYNSLKSIGSVYSWHASISVSTILLETTNKENSKASLEKEFNLLTNPNFEHYYDLANFYKDNEYYEESIKYYSLALNELKRDHRLVPKIFDRRGTSYERLGDWKNAEKDLLESLKILPDQPHVLNYLAYSWVDKGINLDKGLEMLIKAASLKKNDGYIIDSLGWAYYAKKNYIEAEKFLREAIQLLPSEPIINDHYADSLWMLNKSIQARYFWNYVLSLKSTKKKLKDIVSKKIIFGIIEKL